MKPRTRILSRVPLWACFGCVILSSAVGIAYSQQATTNTLHFKPFGTNYWHPNTKRLDVDMGRPDPILGDAGITLARDVKNFYQLLRDNHGSHGNLRRFVALSAYLYWHRGFLSGLQASLLCLAFGCMLVFGAQELYSDMLFFRELRNHHASTNQREPNQPAATNPAMTFRCHAEGELRWFVGRNRSA